MIEPWTLCPCGKHAWTPFAEAASSAPDPSRWTWCDELGGEYPLAEDVIEDEKKETP